MGGGSPHRVFSILKTFTNLYPKITTFENLYLAYRQARKGKRANVAVADFELNFESILLNLQEDLISLTPVFEGVLTEEIVNRWSSLLSF